MKTAARVLWRLGSFGVGWILAQGIFESLAGPLFGALSRAAGEPVAMYPVSMLVGVLAGSWTGFRFMDAAPWTLMGIGDGVWHPRRLLFGGMIGTAAIVLTAGALWVGRLLHVEPVAPMAFVGESWSGTALRMLLVLAPAALWEELAFRGYLYGVASEAGGESRGPLFARLTSSVVFGLVHLTNPGAGVRTTAIVMLAGWCLCLLRERVGLPGAWTAHLAWNWVMAAVLHVPVSGLPFATPGYRAVVAGPEWVTGGPWGPEGGAVAALVLVVAAGAAHRASRRRAPSSMALSSISSSSSSSFLRS